MLLLATPGATEFRRSRAANDAAAHTRRAKAARERFIIRAAWR